MFKKIAPDKWKHFYVGIAMGMVLQAMGWWLFSGELLWATIFAFSIVVVISYGFELYSKFTGKGHYEVLDAVASIIGGIVGMGLCFLFIRA